jgi:hypothetical protein
VGRRLLTLAAAALLLIGPGAAGAQTAPTAQTVTSIPTVGALFYPSVLGLLPMLNGPHFCSGSVVHSSGHDLVLTAAHCVYGPGLTLEFAPGFHDGIAPYGVWDVTKLYIDPAWAAGQDPHRDVALLQVAPRDGRQIEDVVGAHPLGVPSIGAAVTVDGYPAGSGGEPITCTNHIYDTQGYPSFDCNGFVSGVSGGPWYTGDRLVGATGGLDQGGCTDATSYSAPFGAWTFGLLQRAEADGPGDLAPIAFLSSSC